MADADTAKKRASAVGLGLPWGRVVAQIDGANLEDEGERLAAAGLYAFIPDEPVVLPSVFEGGFSARSAFATGLYAIVGSAGSVKPAPRVVIKTTTWADMVRFAEGPVEHSRRKRYVAYRFGGGRGPTRQFWGG